MPLRIGSGSHSPTYRSGRAQLVDRQPRRHGRDERARRLEPLAILERPVDPQQRLLNHVFCLGDRPQHR